MRISHRNSANENAQHYYSNKTFEVVKVSNRMKEYTTALAKVQEVCQEFDQLDPENVYHKPESRFDIEGDYYDNIAEFERLVANAREESARSTSEFSTESTRHDSGIRKFKLPSPDLPIFSGEYENWLSFKSEFEAAIHSQQDLSKVTKLSYLRRCLKDTALDKVKMLPVTEENYDRAWTILNETYSNDRLIISRHFQLLLNFPKQLQETAASLTKIVDDTRQHVEMLKTVGVTINDETIVAMVENILYRATIDAWEETLTKGIFPTSKERLEFLSQRASRFSVRDNAKCNSETRIEETTTNKYNNKRSHAKAFYTATDTKCSVCDQDHHALYKCKKFRNMNVPRRLETVKNHSFCENCLLKGHGEEQCASKHMRWVCEGRHNTLIHTESNANSEG
ncbi:uncharacterized protein LOC135170881 isoform X2 [Diachasmimorpha longicaudata]|uniref:uncharacterized protein LOC135170881 isoform X2 n=1 Tax=Diachasmimorpha longicaudata TaxID=58733 RepID=UPI0030B86EBA